MCVAVTVVQQPAQDVGEGRLHWYVGECTLALGCILMLVKWPLTLHSWTLALGGCLAWLHVRGSRWLWPLPRCHLHMHVEGVPIKKDKDVHPQRVLYPLTLQIYPCFLPAHHEWCAHIQCATVFFLFARF